MSGKILVTGTSVRTELLDGLVAAGYSVDNPTHVLSESELSTALSDASGYLLGGDEFASEAALSAAKKLKVIAFLGMGYQSFVDSAAAKKYNIAITNTPGTLSNAVAEFTVGLVLNASRKIYKYATEYASGQRGQEEKQRDLRNLTVGIVGLGGVGIRIAEILRAGFGCAVVYYSRTRKENEEDRLGIRYRQLDSLCSEVDVIIVMTPSTTETIGSIGKKQIASMKKGAILINTARPVIVDGPSLLDGLQTGVIDYAAFDGFYDGPPDLVADLKKLIPTRLMVTGHIGSLTHDARDAMARKAILSLSNVLESGSDENRVV